MMNKMAISKLLSVDFGKKWAWEDTVIRFFDYDEQNGYLKIVIGWLWEKNERGRGPRCTPIFFVT